MQRAYSHAFHIFWGLAFRIFYLYFTQRPAQQARLITKEASRLKVMNENTRWEPTSWRDTTKWVLIHRVVTAIRCLLTLCFVQFKLPAATGVLPHTSPCRTTCYPVPDPSRSISSSWLCLSSVVQLLLRLVLLLHFLHALLLPARSLLC